MSALRASPLGTIIRSAARSRAATSTFTNSSPRYLRQASWRLYSTEKPATETKDTEASSSASTEETKPEKSAAETKVAELEGQLEEKNKTIAELKDARLRSLADYENLQKISTREKQQAKDFALTGFARDLISSIDILALAVKSVPEHKVVAGHKDATPDTPPNPDLVQLFEGLTLTKKEIEKVLKRHGVVAFNPLGEPFDPNRHEALYQAPVPGKEPNSILEVQEIGYMIKDRLLRPAKVGVVLGTQ